MKRLLWIALIAAALPQTWSLAQEAKPKSDHLVISLSDPSRLGQVNVNVFQGKIKIRTHESKDVVIEPHKSPINAPFSPPEEARGLRRLNQPYPGFTAEDENNVISISSSPPGPNGDIEIWVPEKMNLKVRMINGELAVEGVDGDIEINNVNSRITLTDVSGSVVAHSVNGGILANIKSVTPGKPLAFTSFSGPVDVTLPADIHANLKMRSSRGGVYTDFDVQMNESGSEASVEDSRSRGGNYRIEMNMSIDGTINGGGPDIELRSFNGSVYIRKSK